MFKIFSRREQGSPPARAEPALQAEQVPAVHNQTGATTIVNYEELGELLGDGSGIAGMSAEQAMRTSAVYACVRLLGGAIASMRMEIYRRNGTARSLADDHPLWWKFNEEPCAMMTAPMMWEYFVTSQCFYGDAFALLLRDPRNPTIIDDVIPLDPRSVWVWLKGGRYYYVVSLPSTYGEEMLPVAFDQDDILHFAGPGFNPRTGRSMSVLKYAASRAVPIAQHAEELADKAFTKGNMSDVVLKFPKQLSKEQREDLRNYWVRKHSGLGNVGAPAILGEGGDVAQLKMTAVDAQLLESRSFQVTDIARAFGVPPWMIGETSKTTSWGSGVSEMGRGFVLYSVRPYLNRYEAETNRKTFRTARFFAEFDVTRLTRGDPAAEAAYYRQAIGGSQGPGWMSIDEVRARNNLPPLGGTCAQVYFPQAPASGNTNASDGDQGPTGGDGPPNPATTDPEGIPE
jgi:HK97 family phage portal protein